MTDAQDNFAEATFQDAAQRTPTSVWEELLAGNARFTRGEPARPNQDIERRTFLQTGQAPKAVVLSCSDSRVPVELVFDQGLGDVFVIRTAGEITDLSVLASLEYAVVTLGIPLVVVLGHENCGAVAAAEDAVERGALPSGFQRVLVEKVTPSILSARAQGKTTRAAFETHHVQEIVQHIIDRSPQIKEGLEAGRVGVVGLRCRLDDGHADTVVQYGV